MDQTTFPLQPGLIPGRLGWQLMNPLRDMVRLNCQHHLALGLKACLVPAPNGYVDLVRRGRIATQGSMASKGRGITTGTSAAAQWSGSGAIAATTELDFTSGGWSLGGWATPISLSATDAWLMHSDYSSESVNSGLLIGSGSTGAVACVQVYKNNGSASYRLEIGTITAGVPYSLVATGDGTTVRLYLNGAQVATSTTMNQYPATLTSVNVPVLRLGSTTSVGHIGCMWGRTLSAAEVLKFHYHPMALLQGPPDEFLPYGAPTYGLEYQTWQTG